LHHRFYDDSNDNINVGKHNDLNVDEHENDLDLNIDLNVGNHGNFHDNDLVFPNHCNWYQNIIKHINSYVDDVDIIQHEQLLIVNLVVDRDISNINDNQVDDCHNRDEHDDNRDVNINDINFRDNNIILADINNNMGLLHLAHNVSADRHARDGKNCYSD